MPLPKVRSLKKSNICSHGTWIIILVFLFWSLTRLSEKEVNETIENVEVSNQISSNPKKEKFLFSTPRSGGFNNQLITVYESIRCAQILGRTLVLPLIYENVRADTSSKGYGPFPFDDYFDIESLSNVVDAVTPENLFANNANPCDGAVLYGSSKHFYALEYRVPRLLKQQYQKKYKIQPVFVPELARRNGIRVRNEALCIDDSACPNLESSEEFGMYSNYDGDGQGYSIRNSETLRTIRSSMLPSSTVRRISDTVFKFIGGSFNAMHVRRGDFGTKCDELPKVCEKYGSEAVWQTKEGLQQIAMQFKNPKLPLFISTTHPEECKELFSGSGMNLVFMEDVPLPSEFKWAENRTDIIAYASQVVASRSVEFIGNRFSSYSTTINYMRIIENLQAPTIFF